MLGFNSTGLVQMKSRENACTANQPCHNGDNKGEVVCAGCSLEPFEHWILLFCGLLAGVGLGFWWSLRWDGERSGDLFWLT